MKGIGLPINCIHPDTLSYEPNMATILRDLNVDSAHIYGGIEGPVWRIDMELYPDEWAENLYNLLNLLGNMGLKVYFHCLSDGFRNLLGITQPQPVGPELMTPLNVALERIDFLAGNNVLGYNFIEDPRIISWAVANEIDISISEDLNWCIAVLDKIRNYGGKAHIASARYQTWREGEDLSIVYPLIEGHVDYLDYHLYGISKLVNDYAGIITQDYINWYFGELERQVNYCKSIGWNLNRFILGEFGIWIGHGSDMGVDHTFDDETRKQYYEMVLNSTKNLGIKNIFNHQLHEQTKPEIYPNPAPTNWAIIALDGTYYLPAYVLKTSYTPIFPWNTILKTVGPIGVGLYLIGKSPRRR